MVFHELCFFNYIQKKNNNFFMKLNNLKQNEILFIK